MKLRNLSPPEQMGERRRKVTAAAFVEAAEQIMEIRVGRCSSGAGKGDNPIDHALYDAMAAMFRLADRYGVKA